jgi:hypothetical protein
MITLESIQMWEITLTKLPAGMQAMETYKLKARKKVTSRNQLNNHHLAAATALYAIVALRKFVRSKVEEETRTVLAELRLLHPAARWTLLSLIRIGRTAGLLP